MSAAICQVFAAALSAVHFHSRSLLFGKGHYLYVRPLCGWKWRPYHPSSNGTGCTQHVCVDAIFGFSKETADAAEQIVSWSTLFHPVRSTRTDLCTTHDCPDASPRQRTRWRWRCSCSCCSSTHSSTASRPSSSARRSD